MLKPYLTAYASVHRVAVVQEEGHDCVIGPSSLVLTDDGKSLSLQECTQLKRVLDKHARTLSTEPGCTEAIKMTICLSDNRPFSLKPYTTPPRWKVALREEIDKLLLTGIIVETTSPWSSPIVTVVKKDGSLRMCIDYRNLNSKTVPDPYLMPKVEELLEQLANAVYISKIDLNKGYYQIPIAQENEASLCSRKCLLATQCPVCFASHTHLLTDATRKTAPDKVAWTPEMLSEFHDIRSALCSIPSLTLPTPTDSFVLQTDSSQFGIGAVLNVICTDEELPVAFYSRKLLLRERCYAATELEGLALVDAIDHFSVYLIGQPFIAETDHKALIFLQSAKHVNSRLARWALRLQPYTFEVRYRPGSENGNADALSRQGWDAEDEEKDLQSPNGGGGGGGGVVELHHSPTYQT